MTHLSMRAIEDIGRRAAREVVGEDAERIEVVSGQDSTNRPAYFISLRFDRDRHSQVAALLRTRLAQKIRDELISHGDARYPIIRLLDRGEWERLHNARPA